MVTKTIKFNGREFNIPAVVTIGHYTDIEVQKDVRSRSCISMMALSHEAARNAAEAIEVEAVLMVMAPEVIKDLKCKFSELGIKDYLTLKDLYYTELLPMLKEAEEMMRP